MTLFLDTVPLLVDTVALLIDTVDGKGFVVVLCNAKQFDTSWLCVVLIFMNEYNSLGHNKAICLVLNKQILCHEQLLRWIYLRPCEGKVSFVTFYQILFNRLWSFILSPPQNLENLTSKWSEIFPPG